MLRAEGISKNFGSIQALNEVGLSLKKGEITLLLGPNGAGKTTLMKALAGVLVPDAGTIFFEETPIHFSSPPPYRLGWLPDEEPFFEELNVKQQIELALKLQGASLQDLPFWLERLSLHEVSQRRVKDLSLGYRQRVGLAMALCGKPDVLLLDEPGNGLDPRQFQELEVLLKEIRNEHAILISTHRIRDCEALADQILLMRQGQIQARVSRQEWELQRTNQFLIEVEPRQEETLQTILKELEISSHPEEKSFCLSFQSEKDALNLLQILAQRNILPLHFGLKQPDLQSIFLALSEDS